MTDLTTATPATSSKSKTSIDHTLNLAELKERTVEPPRMEPMPRASLSAIAAANLKRKIVLPKAEVLKLTARHPYDPAGLMDFYQPGRWDSTSDLVFMSSIVTGPEPGMWDGTAGYVQCAAPADGDYLIVVHFTGYQQTMRIDGPWGTATAHTASTSDAGAVTALWTGPAGTTLYFTMNCVSDDGYAGIGYLQSIEMFALPF